LLALFAWWNRRSRRHRVALFVLTILVVAFGIFLERPMTDHERVGWLGSVFGGVLLFPCLGVVYVGLVALSDRHLPFEIQIFGHRELSQLTLGGEFGALAGVPFVFALGLGGAIALLIARRHHRLTSPSSVSWYVAAFYLAALLIFFLMPPIFGGLMV